MKLPRFTLRDLFWLVLVVGMGCGWWVERQSLTGDVRRLHELAAENAVRIGTLESELAGYSHPDAVYVRDQHGILHNVTSKP
jgi:hypothetical protein